MNGFDTEVQVCAHRVAVRYWDIPQKAQADDLEQRLSTEGESRAKSQASQGYFSGELNCLVNEVEVRGWWEIIS